MKVDSYQFRRFRFSYRYDVDVTRRGYNQFCATTRSLDLIGERWTLLIIRELLTGPKRFRDLQRNLPGLGAALLSSRLGYMESEGLVRRSQLPAPARAPAYELTTAGWETTRPCTRASRTVSLRAGTARQSGPTR